MTDKEYNFICLPFQFLTKRFHNFQNLYEGVYECYDPKMYGVKGEYLKFLKNFQHLTFRHIFNEEKIVSQIALGIQVDIPLVVIEEKRICVHQELGFITLHILANKLKKGIEQLMTLLEEIKTKYPKSITTDEKGNIISLKMFQYDQFISEFENLSDYKYVKDLFYDSKSGIITLNVHNEIDFKIYKMKDILERLSIFNFGNIPI